ncbi:MAG: dockerin type I domain-containing protein [Erysipelotrichaceae bacterium]
MKKRIRAFLLIGSLMLTLLPVPTFAKTENETEQVHSNEETTDMNLITHLPDYNELYGITPRATSKQIVLNKRSRSATQNLAYISVFVEFPDEIGTHLDDENTLKAADMIMNTGGELLASASVVRPIIPLKEYINKYSYKKLDVTTSFFPKNEDGKVISYMSSKPRSYYKKQSATNPNGYVHGQMGTRENELIEEILLGVKPSIEKNLTASQIDSGNDSYIDAITFFMEAPSRDDVGWSELLWSHKADSASSTKILGKSLNSYNLISVSDTSKPGSPFSYSNLNGKFQVARANYAVIQHEYLHTLGLPDLYRGYDKGAPVGFYDIMADTNAGNPQGLTAVMSRDMLRWASPIEEKTMSSTITLNKAKYKDPNEKNAVKIKSPLHNGEYFVIEFYEKTKEIGTNVGRSDGLIAYRINDNVSSSNITGKEDGLEDYMYIFRPDEVKLGQGKGTLSNAVILPNKGNTYGKTISEANAGWDNNTLFYSDGSNSGIKLTIKEATNDSITFDVIVPSTIGSGTQVDPYIMNSVNDFQIMRNNPDKYYKLGANIDFTGVDFTPIPIFKGKLDGNNKVVSNVTVKNGGGFFDSIDSTAELKDFTLENINVLSLTDGHTGSLAGNFSGKATNITVNGKVKGTSGAYTFQGVGGFAGTVGDVAIVENCAISVDVSGGYNVGGMVGLNQKGTYIDSFVNGKVSDATNHIGAFIGEDFQSSTLIENCAFDIDKTGQTKALNNQDLKGITGYKKTGDISLKLDGFENANLPIVSLPLNDKYKSTVEFKDKSIAVYDDSSKKVTGKQAGETQMIVGIQIGSRVMPIEVKVSVSGKDFTTDYQSGKEIDEATITYKSKPQTKDWQNIVTEGNTSGTVHSNLRLDQLKINLKNVPTSSVLNGKMLIGNDWQTYSNIKNTTALGNEGKQISQLAFSVKGLEDYSLMYRVFNNKSGWQEWKFDGEIAGSASDYITATEFVLIKNNDQKIMPSDMKTAMNTNKIKMKDLYLTGFTLKEENKVAKAMDALACKNTYSVNLYDENGNLIKVDNQTMLKTGDVIFVSTKGTNHAVYRYTVVIKGDVNGDGKITSMDYALVKNDILNITKLKGASAVAGDVDESNTIKSMDYALIKNDILNITKIIQ